MTSILLPYATIKLDNIISYFITSYDNIVVRAHKSVHEMLTYTNKPEKNKSRTDIICMEKFSRRFVPRRGIFKKNKVFTPYTLSRARRVVQYRKKEFSGLFQVFRSCTYFRNRPVYLCLGILFGRRGGVIL